MKTKTSELTGAALDWAVGHALGYDYEIVDSASVTGKTLYTSGGIGFDEVWMGTINQLGTRRTMYRMEKD